MIYPGSGTLTNLSIRRFTHTLESSKESQLYFKALEMLRKEWANSVFGN